MSSDRWTGFSARNQSAPLCPLPRPPPGEVDPSPRRRTPLLRSKLVAEMDEVKLHTALGHLLERPRPAKKGAGNLGSGGYHRCMAGSRMGAISDPPRALFLDAT